MLVLNNFFQKMSFIKKKNIPKHQRTRSGTREVTLTKKKDMLIHLVTKFMQYTYILFADNCFSG